jgi:hypothetical protein
MVCPGKRAEFLIHELLTRVISDPVSLYPVQRMPSTNTGTTKHENESFALFTNSTFLLGAFLMFAETVALELFKAVVGRPPQLKQSTGGLFPRSLRTLSNFMWASTFINIWLWIWHFYP